MGILADTYCTTYFETDDDVEFHLPTLYNYLYHVHVGMNITAVCREWEVLSVSDMVESLDSCQSIIRIVKLKKLSDY